MMLFGITGLYTNPHRYISHQLVYGKACHFPVELEHKAMLAMKKLKMDWNEAVDQRLNGLNELDAFLLKAYESSALYKEKMKKYDDRKIEKRKLAVRDLVLLFNSMLCLFSGKTQVQMDWSILDHLKCSHTERLSWRTRRVQGSQ